MWPDWLLSLFTIGWGGAQWQDTFWWLLHWSLTLLPASGGRGRKESPWGGELNQRWLLVQLTSALEDLKLGVRLHLVTQGDGRNLASDSKDMEGICLVTPQFDPPAQCEIRIPSHFRTALRHKLGASSLHMNSSGVEVKKDILFPECFLGHNRWKHSHLINLIPVRPVRVRPVFGLKSGPSCVVFGPWSRMEPRFGERRATCPDVLGHDLLALQECGWRLTPSRIKFEIKPNMIQNFWPPWTFCVNSFSNEWFSFISFSLAIK